MHSVVPSCQEGTVWNLSLASSARLRRCLMCKAYLIASVKSINEYDQEMPQ